MTLHRLLAGPRAAALAAAAAACLALAAAPAAALELALSPGQVFVPFDEGGGTGRFELSNASGADMRLRTEIAEFDIGPDNDLRLRAPTADSFSNWVVLAPLEFDLPTGATRTVRFAIRPLSRPQRGEYRAMIMFSEATARSRAGALSFKVQVGVPVYASFGEVTRAATLDRVYRAAPGRLGFEVTAAGDAHSRLRGRYAVFPPGADPGQAAVAEAFRAAGAEDRLRALGARAVGRLPDFPVFPGETRRLDVAVEGLPASGVVHLSGALGDAPLSRSVRY